MLFLLFSIAFIFLLYLHFAVAHYVWNGLRGQSSSELDLGYIRLEDYFGQSFRAKLRDWLSLPSTSDSTANLRVIDRGSEKLYVSGSTSYPAGRKEDAVLIIEGDFNSGANCSFERELMIRGNGKIGSGAKMQAIAADGALEIGSNVVIRRWVDAGGAVTIGANSTISSKVCSRESVLLEAGSSAASIFAPEIVSEGRMDTVATSA